MRVVHDDWENSLQMDSSEKCWRRRREEEEGGDDEDDDDDDDGAGRVTRARKALKSEYWKKKKT